MNNRRAIPRCLLACTAFALWGCGENADLDLGADTFPAPIPVNSHFPVVLVDDGFEDDWTGELTMAASSSGRIRLLDILVQESAYHVGLQAQLTGWRAIAAAARASGMKRIVEPTGVAAPPLQRPADGRIESTSVPSTARQGGERIVALIKRYGTRARPVALVFGCPLTLAAHAYLFDPSIADRAIVISTTGSIGGAAMAPQLLSKGDNGELDPWAVNIVATRMRFVPVVVAHTIVITTEELASLADTPLRTWMQAKRSIEFGTPRVSDALGIIHVADPRYAQTSVRGVFEQVGDDFVFRADNNGSNWFVPVGDSEVVRAVFWGVLRDPAAYHAP